MTDYTYHHKINQTKLHTITKKNPPITTTSHISQCQVATKQQIVCTLSEARKNFSDVQ